MPKKMGVNSKAEAARERRSAAEADRRERVERAKEEQYWREAEGPKSRAVRRREEDAEKRAEAAACKAENRRIAEEEAAAASAPSKTAARMAARVGAPAPKVTEADLARRREEEWIRLERVATAGAPGRCRPVGWTSGSTNRTSATTATAPTPRSPQRRRWETSSSSTPQCRRRRTTRCSSWMACSWPTAPPPLPGYPPPSPTSASSPPAPPVPEAAIATAPIARSKKGAYMFGRIDLCDFVLEHPTISRFHAVLQFRNEGEIFLYDLGSTHGSFINKPQTSLRDFTSQPFYCLYLLKISWK